MPRVIALIALIIFCTSTQAQIYKWTDSSGKTHYSNDKPNVPDAEALPIQENYTQGRPAYQRQPSSQQMAPRPQSHYIHAAKPGASLGECERAKIDAVYAAKAKSRGRNERLEDWIWKNCRTYSRELRKIEQQMM